MMVELLLVKSTNKVGTEIFYLGHFAMQSLHRDKVPHVDNRQAKYLESIAICSDNGYLVRNKRHNTAKTSSSNKRQESSASKKNSITPSATKKARTDPKTPLSSSDEELSRSLTEPSSKDKETTLTDDQFSSDNESEKSKNSSPNTDQEKQAASSTISLLDIMNGILADTRSV
jgi:hypothetical protein